MAQKKFNNTNNMNKRKNNKGLKKLALIVVFILILIIIFVNLKSDSKNIKNDKIQLILNNTNITSNLENDIILKDDKIYMAIDDVRKFLDNTIYEENTGLIITTSTFKTATLSLENTENITVNSLKQDIQNAVIEENEKKYIAISELEKVYNYEFKFIKDTNISIIDSLNKELAKAEVKKNTKVKKEDKTFAKVIEKIKKGDTVFYLGEENGKAKIRTQNGNIGYIKVSSLINITNIRENFDEVSSQQVDKDDITSKDISTFKKREEVINLILQELIKNDNMYVKFNYDGEEQFYFERFKIEATPIMQECGITIAE